MANSSIVHFGGNRRVNHFGLNSAIVGLFTPGSIGFSTSVRGKIPAHVNAPFTRVTGWLVPLERRGVTGLIFTVFLDSSGLGEQVVAVGKVVGKV